MSLFAKQPVHCPACGKLHDSEVRSGPDLYALLAICCDGECRDAIRKANARYILGKPAPTPEKPLILKAPMPDQRADDAQALFWQIQRARGEGRGDAEVRDLLCKMADLHEALSKDRIAAGNPTGWIDLLAAVTALRDAGEPHRARRLICLGRELMSSWPKEVCAVLESQLAELESKL